MIDQVKLLSLKELFKKSFEVYFSKMWLLAKIVLFSLTALAVLVVFFSISYLLVRDGDAQPLQILVALLIGLIGVFCSIVLSVWSKTALYLAIKQSGTIKELLQLGWSHMGSLLWVTVLVSLVVLGGYILLIIPGVIFSVWFIFATYVYIFEGIKGTAALKRSKQLVQGYWWPVLGRIILVGIASWALVSFIKFIGPILNMFFVAPFIMVYMSELYKDLVRVKG